VIDIARLPIVELSLGPIDDSAAIALSTMTTLRTLEVGSASLSPKGVRRLMTSRSLRSLGFGLGTADRHSWELWKTVASARCGTADLVARYCPAPDQSLVCGTNMTQRTCSK